MTHPAENDAAWSAHTYVEYAAVVDRTSKGLGFFLAEVSRDENRVRSIVDRSDALFGFPAEMKRRVVTCAAWERVISPEVP